MEPIILRVAARFSFRFEPKETKERKVEKTRDAIRDATGLSRGMSEAIADALVRGREVERLALQKGWPIENSVITGPAGEFALNAAPY